ncbi:hypothetical protein ACG3SL_17045 [Sphingomonas sp. CJ20]
MRFLDTLAATCNVRMSADASGMCVQGAYGLRRRDPEFARLWREALTIGYQRLEEALLEHALGSVSPDAIALEPVQLPHTPQGSAEPIGVSAGQRALVRTPGTADYALALQLLNRHRATVEGSGKPAHPRRATEDETNAALMKKLDTLARQRGNKA